MESLRAGTGALNLLNKQEAELVKLRDEQEALVVAELNRARSELETEGRLTQLGKLCATPFGVDIVGITEFVALIGALVGGTLPPPLFPTTLYSDPHDDIGSMGWERMAFLCSVLFLFNIELYIHLTDNSIYFSKV